jgi:hypothetical protein
VQKCINVMKIFKNATFLIAVLSDCDHTAGSILFVSPFRKVPTVSGREASAEVEGYLTTVRAKAK